MHSLVFIRSIPVRKLRQYFHGTQNQWDNSKIILCYAHYPAVTDALLCYLTHWGRVTHTCTSKLTKKASLGPTMACRLAGTKPLSEPMFNVANWTLTNKLQWNLNRNSYTFIQENSFQNVVWKMAVWPRPHLGNNTEYHEPSKGKYAVWLIIHSEMIDINTNTSSKSIRIEYTLRYLKL